MKLFLASTIQKIIMQPWWPCEITLQYFRSCCSPIGQNNTKDFSAQSGGSIGRAVWKRSGKSRFPGAFFALLVNIRRFISLPDLFPLAPTNCPWVSEDEWGRASVISRIHTFVRGPVSDTCTNHLREVGREDVRSVMWECDNFSGWGTLWQVLCWN